MSDSDDRANIVFKGEFLWEFDNKLTEDQVKRYEVEYDGTGHDLMKGQTTYFYSPPTHAGECEFLIDEIKHNEEIGNDLTVQMLKGELADHIEWGKKRFDYKHSEELWDRWKQANLVLDFLFGDDDQN